MVPRSFSALLRPKRSDPSTWERTPSGFTTMPQSTAQMIFSTRTLPVAGSTRACTTEAVHVGVFFSCAALEGSGGGVRGLPQHDDQVGHGPSPSTMDRR